MAEEPLNNLQLYRKVHGITYSHSYWQITTDARALLDEYYQGEEDYADRLEDSTDVF